MGRAMTGRVDGGFVDTTVGLVGLGWEALMRAPIALAVLDAEGRFLLGNDALVALLGLRPEHLRGTTWIDHLVPEPEWAPGVRSLVADLARREGPAVRHQGQLSRASDGVARFIDFTSSPCALPDGRRGVCVTMVDITEAAPGSVGGRGFRELVDDAPDILSRLDAHTGRVLFVSRAVERISGFSPEELARDPGLLRRQVQPEYREAWREARRAAAQGTPQTLVVGMVRKDGQPFLLHQALLPVRNALGEVSIVEGLARDITAVRSLETQLERTVEELRTRNAELASLDRLKSQLLANVSHELRTPLVSIKGYNELLLAGALGPLTPRQRRGLEIARSNTDRLVDLIETLLDFARREEGRLTLHRTRTDVGAIAHEVAAAFQARLGERGIRLAVDVANEPLEVDGDRARLLQALRALLSNAEKFCAAAGGTIDVVARREEAAARTPSPGSSRAGGCVVVEVRDTGIGIPPSEQQRIFEPFYQVDSSATRRFGGAGLGLALAREIATLHGGEISVASAERRGSTFTLRIPALGASTGPAPSGDQPVLLVGLPEPRWRAARDQLEAAGFSPLHAETPEVVLRRARRHRPDAVVLGFGEPTDELTALLKSEPGLEDVPVVVLAEGDARGLFEHADHVVGGGDLAALVGAIRRLLAPRPTEAAAEAPRPCVLVADDDPGNLDFTRFLLEREGYEVVSVGTGEALLQRVERAARADLVILDFAMGGLDGLEVCRRLKGSEVTTSVPVLMVTAMTGEGIRRAALAAGADGFLLKPFGVAEFLRQVRLHVRAEAGEKA